MGHKDAIQIRVTNYLHHIRDTNIADEVVEDIKLWLNVFGLKKACLTFAQIACDQMKPMKCDV
jgi:hypothetical protein